MENKRDWSKLIAIALSFIIVTQFIQVAFLGAQKFGIGAGADAGADASRGSIAEEAYGAVWEYIGDSDSMIMTAAAATGSPLATESMNVTYVTATYSDNNIGLDYSSVSANEDRPITFTFCANAPTTFSADGSGAHFTIAFPDFMNGLTPGTFSPNDKGITSLELDNNNLHVNIAAGNTMSAGDYYTITATAKLINDRMPPTSGAGVWPDFYGTQDLNVTLPAKYVAPDPTVITASVTVKEKDSTTTISGATFALYKGNTDTGRTAGPTGDDGKASITVSENGNYSLRQSNSNLFSANGKSYYKSNVLYAFSVNNGNVSPLATGGGVVNDKTISFEVENDPYENTAPQPISDNGTIKYGVVESGTTTFIDPTDAVFTLTSGGENITLPSNHDGDYGYTKSSLSAGDYILTQTAPAKGHKLLQPIAVSFTVSTNGTLTEKSISPNGQATFNGAGTTGTIYFANAISGSDVAGTGSITINRKIQATRTGSKDYPATGADEMYQILQSDKKTPAAISGNGDTMRKSLFEGLSYGTYYIKDIEADKMFTFARYSGTAGVEETESGSHIWGPVTIDSTHKDVSVILLVNRVHNVTVNDQNGDALAGEKIKLEPQAGSSFVSVSANDKEWTLDQSGKVDLSQYLADSGHYTLSIPSISGSGNLTVAFDVNGDGTIGTRTPSNASVLSTTANGNDFTVTRKDTEARVTLQLCDLENAEDKITYSAGAAYKLYSVSGGDYVELEDLTVNSGIATSAKKYENGTYAVAEAGTNKAPAGYVPKNTSATDIKYYQFKIENGVRTTLNSGSDTVWPIGEKELKLYYTRKPASLVITRSDASGIPAGTVVKYRLINVADASDYIDATPVTATANGITSISFNGLDWDKEYALKETSNKTSTYSPDEHGEYKSFRIHPDSNVRKFASDVKATDYNEAENMIIGYATITPSKKQAIVFKYMTAALGTTASTAKAGTFTIKDKSRTETGYTGITLDIPALSTGKSTDELLTSHTYTVTKASDNNGYGTAVQPTEFEFSIDENGKVTIGTITSGDASVTEAATTGGSPTITITDKLTDVCFQFAVACSEDVDSTSTERGYVNGVVFQVYTDAECKTAPSEWYDASGTKKTAADSKVTTAADSNMTPKDGIAHMRGLPIGTASTPAKYYVKLVTIPTAYKMIIPDTTSTFELSVDQKGVVTVDKPSIIGKNTDKTSTMVKDTIGSNRILARVYRGKFKLITVARKNENTTLNGAKFNVYRIEETYSTTSMGRSEAKMKGTLDGYSSSGEGDAKKKWTPGVRIAALIDGIKALDDYFVLKAKAATEYIGNQWELIDTVTSSSNGEVSISGLVPGQAYLISNVTPADGYTKTTQPIIIKTSLYDAAVTNNEYDNAVKIDTILDFNKDTDSDRAVKVNGATVKWLETSSSDASSSSSSSGKSGSSNASTSKSNTGSGTQNSGTGAGGRGAATGDDSRLWFHLIVMLVAFDALAADLLYITRKKKKMRS